MSKAGKRRNKLRDSIRAERARLDALIREAIMESEEKYANPFAVTIRAFDEEGVHRGVGIVISEAMPCSCGCGQQWPLSWAIELAGVARQAKADGVLDRITGAGWADRGPLPEGAFMLSLDDGTPMVCFEQSTPTLTGYARHMPKDQKSLDSFADVVMDALAYAVHNSDIPGEAA